MIFDMRTRCMAEKFLDTCSTAMGVSNIPALLDHHDDDVFSLSASLERQIRRLSNEIDWQNVSIIGTHVLGSLDDCSEVKQNGLKGLAEVLAGDTILSRLLRERGIVVDVKNKMLRCGASKYDINYERFCRRYVLDGLDEALLHIARRVYADSGLTAFLYTSDPKNYGTDIHLRPEFIGDLARVCLEASKLDLWWKSNSTPYEIDFFATIDQINTITFGLEPSCEYSLGEYEKESIAKWMFETSLLRSQNRLAETCLFLKPEACIPSSQFISCRAF